MKNRDKGKDGGYSELWPPRCIEDATSDEEIIGFWVESGAVVPAIMDDEDDEDAELVTREAAELLAELEVERRAKK